MAAALGLAGLALLVYFRPAGRPVRMDLAHDPAVPRNDPASAPGSVPGTAASTRVDPPASPTSPGFSAVQVRKGRILGQVILPVPREEFAYRIYLFTAAGASERQERYSNTDRFELADVSPGRKAVVFLSPTGEFTFTHQIVTVPEGGDAEVVLRPGQPHPLVGTVVDASGRPVPDVLVIVTETSSLPQDLYTEVRPKNIALVGSFGGRTKATAGGPNPPTPTSSPGPYSQIDPGEGRISRGVPTDAEGRFELSASSASTPVKLRVARTLKDTLLEENVVPSSSPLRVVVPQ